MTTRVLALQVSLSSGLFRSGTKLAENIVAAAHTSCFSHLHESARDDSSAASNEVAFARACTECANIVAAAHTSCFSHLHEKQGAVLKEAGVSLDVLRTIAIPGERELGLVEVEHVQGKVGLGLSHIIPCKDWLAV
jgi:hypothetical protein